jgi:hypothetical protein
MRTTYSDLLMAESLRRARTEAVELARASSTSIASIEDAISAVRETSRHRIDTIYVPDLAAFLAEVGLSPPSEAQLSNPTLYGVDVVVDRFLPPDLFAFKNADGKVRFFRRPGTEAAKVEPDDEPEDAT